jgi:hypothetical protein
VSGQWNIGAYLAAARPTSCADHSLKGSGDDAWAPIDTITEWGICE